MDCKALRRIKETVSCFKETAVLYLMPLVLSVMLFALCLYVFVCLCIVHVDEFH
ncbi:hypothetical protein ACRRTK_023933 [Alexandromys fortis]